MVIDNAIGGERARPPRAIEKLITREQAASGLDEQGQKLKLDWGDLHRMPATTQLAPREIHIHIAEAVGWRTLLGKGASKQGFDTSAQFMGAEGLGHIIIRAQLEPYYLLCFLRL